MSNLCLGQSKPILPHGKENLHLASTNLAGFQLWRVASGCCMAAARVSKSLRETWPLLLSFQTDSRLRFLGLGFMGRKICSQVIHRLNSVVPGQDCRLLSVSPACVWATNSPAGFAFHSPRSRKDPKETVFFKPRRALAPRTRLPRHEGRWLCVAHKLLGIQLGPSAGRAVLCACWTTAARP